MTPRLRSGFFGLATAVLATTSSYAACPDVPCDCFGEARRYGLVASERLKAAVGATNIQPPWGTRIFVDACARDAVLTEPKDRPTEIQGDLHTLAGAGNVAVRARVLGDPADTVQIAGVVATGGGSVQGPLSAGTIDTTGTHPDVAYCQQAVDDVGAASEMLAALTPTKVLGHLRIQTFMEIDAQPGINVLSAESIYNSAGLIIRLDPDTDAVIVNTRRLVANYGLFLVEGGERTKVVLNVHGDGPSVVVRPSNAIEPILLAPNRTVRMSNVDAAEVYARRLVLRASTIAGPDGCSSPSGAFLETAELF
jgi:hypothetical protein